jgi:hypothetical protein
VPRLWLVVVLGAIGIMGLSRMPSVVDLAYHVKAGQLMVADHTLPRTDAFAWTTAGRPWLDQNWGAQLLLYGISRLGGFPLLAVVNALLTVAAWGLVAAACRRRTADLRLIAGAVIVGYVASAATLPVRPQMFRCCCSRPSCTCWRWPGHVLVSPWRSPSSWRCGRICMAPSSSGSGCSSSRWRRDRPGAVRYLVVTVASVAALLVNPWGVRVLGYALSLPTSQVVTTLVSEWGPTNLRQTRGVAWFGLALPVALCALARPSSAQPAAADRGTPALNWLVVGGLSVALVAATPSVQRALFGPRPKLAAAPVATADWLAANPQPGRMFNYQPWGSYLEFRLWPQAQVGFDSHIELAPADRWDLYRAVATGRWDTERLLDRWGVDHVVTSRQATPALVELLELSGRWRLAFSTGDQRVYLRAAGPAVSRPSLPPPAP